MFLVAMTVVITLLAGAVAIDLSVVATRGQDLQGAADAAALAGVQAYRLSDGDEGLARAAVADALQQNGIGSDGATSFNVKFPDSAHQTEVTVEVLDSDPGTMLTGVTGVTSVVSRRATARFDSCDAACTINVEIPSPFRSVDAAGTGDGYKPISVDNQLYAINHSSGYGAIVCIDRNTADDPVIEGRCEGWQGKSKPAYATGPYSQRNPEMPHTAVIGSKIYWTASDNEGTKLFCYETLTATPCSSAYTINSRQRADSSMHYKDRNRGGGTVLLESNNQIFVFTDDHRVHCFVPSGATVQPCAGYGSGGEPSFLALDDFPPNDPADGNHGSSIDRIVDEATGRIYWTLHVPEAPTPPADCTQDNMEFPSGLVSIKNAWSGLFMTRDGSDVVPTSDNVDPDTHWRVIPAGTDSYGYPRYAFESATQAWVIDADSGFDPRVDISTSSPGGADDRWSIIYENTTSRIRSDYDLYAYDDGSDFRTRSNPNTGRDDWIIQHPECDDLGFTPGPAPDLIHDSGTWLQCWDATNIAPCAGFTPSAIHTDGSRFSGRLFFHMDSAPQPNIQGVCSSGFDSYVAQVSFEINCVSNFSGAFDEALTTGLLDFENAIRGNTDNGPAAWGDPHYNENANRVFYPTAHDISRTVCWDFDTGMCGVHQQASSLGEIEDYGYFSEGDCVYGLGHNAYFYAFQAEDIFEECTGSTTRTHIEPCDCSGEWKWGTITFDVDLSLFDEFYVQVEDASGDIIYPSPDPAFPDNPGHSLHTDGIVIDLNGLPVSGDPDTDFLEILVAVDSDSDPWAYGEQTFTIEFARAPRLTQ